MSIYPILRITALSLLLAVPMLGHADEWSDAGFTSLRSVIWQSAGYSLREAKRWRSRCNITDPKQVAEWQRIGLKSPTTVSFWINKGYITPEAVVEFRNSELADSDTIPTISPQKEQQQAPVRTSNGQSSTDRKKRDWQRKSELKELMNSGVGTETAEEWIFSGYSSEEAKDWLKIDRIKLPDDLDVWLNLGVDNPEALRNWLKFKEIDSPGDLSAWLRGGVKSPAELNEWLKIEQIANPDDLAAWVNIGTTNPQTVRQWLALAPIKQPDDLVPWLNIGVLTPAEMKLWLSKGLTTAAAVDKQMVFDKSEQEKFTRRGITPERAAEWRRIGAKTFNQVNYLLKKGFTLEELQGWMASGFRVVTDIEIWRATKLSAEESKRWRSAGYSAEHTLMVISEGFTLEEIIGWSEVLGPVSKSMQRIINWRSAGFKIDDTRKWVRAHRDVDAATAAIWRYEGYAPESEWVLLETTPAVVERWRNSGADPATIVIWVQNSFGVSEALPWIENGLNATQSRIWRDSGYSPDEARLWMRHGVTRPGHARKLKQITIDVSDHFTRGLIYNSFRKTAKLLDIHLMPSKIGPRKSIKGKDVTHFDTLTPYAKCMTAYANKTGVSDKTVSKIEKSLFNGVVMGGIKPKAFMKKHSRSCREWTVYIYTIWLVAS